MMSSKYAKNQSKALDQLKINDKPLVPKLELSVLDYECPETNEEIDFLTCESQGITGCKNINYCKAYNQFKTKNKVIRLEDL